MDIAKYVRTVQQAEKFRKASLATGKAFRPINSIAHKYGPEILTGTGILGGIGTIVLASKATLKLEEIVDATRLKIEYAEDTKAAHRARLDGMLEIAKLYAPAATLGAASTGAILGAHGIMRRRNVALIAAYKAIETSFEQYRKRVVEEYGEEKDQDFRYGFENKEKVDKKTNETTTVTHVDPNSHSPYARFFDESCPEWSKTPEYNLVFLTAKQNYANHRLQAYGHLFLNEVYTDLGLPHTKQGAVVGWSMKGDGDKYVDFGIYNMANQEKRNFVNGYERSILLDFNVDGVILDLM